MSEPRLEADAGAEPDALRRTLQGRHIQLIALGGTIGVGLFLGSAGAIHKTGPGLLLCYAIGGAAIFFIIRALGELLTYRPVAGSFASYAEEFVGPFAGFVTGWSYWFGWVATAMAEMTAIGIYAHFWMPQVPQWLPGLCTLALLYAVNTLAVRLYGELEFWFALLKVVTIVGLIVVGLAVLLFHVGPLAGAASVTNLWSHGGFLPGGLKGVVLALPIVMFAYTGVELIGVTAGEARDPAVVLPRATNSIIARILIFYLGALAVIMALIPWDQLDPGASPFVQMFDRMGIPGAADFINVVVITAAASSCNGGLFSTARMLYALGQRGHAPSQLARLSSRHVPLAGLNVSAAAMLVGVILNYLVPKQVFTWVTSITLVGALWTWGIILYAHLRYRQAVALGRARAVPYRMPGFPQANWIVLAFLVLVAAMFSLDPDTRVALYVAPFWFALLWVSYKRRRASAADRD